LRGDTSGSGEFWLDRGLNASDRGRVLASAVAAYRAHPQVAAVFTAEELRGTALPAGRPDQWTLLQRVRASFDPSRSGDFTVVLKEHVAPIPRPSRGYVAGHGTPWDYDRRVPIIFWRPGMPANGDQSPVATIDIAPTLAAMLGLNSPAGTMDGRCLASVPGVTCR
jgi:arylsulfatase A-like enzyme